MDFLKLCKDRYSCRDMSDKKVTKEQLDKIIEAATLAPTACNFQPVKLFIMDSDKAKENIRQVTRFTFNADTFIVVGVDKEKAWNRKYDNKNFADVDGAIVSTHIMLEIENLGLNTTWVGSFDAPKLKELAPELSPYDLIAIFPVGYKKTGNLPVENHFKRKSKDEFVTTL